MTTQKVRMVLALAGSMLFPHQTQAATFTPSALRDGSIVVTLIGEIESGDGAKFRGLIQAASQNGVRVTYLVLNSPGGDVSGGADIAISVRRNAITTIVPAGALCASSCFMPFVAGVRKLYTPTSRIGVHSVVDMRYGENAGAKSTTVDMARFLAELGTPASIIGNMVAMRPDQIAWLSPSELSLIAGSAPLRIEAPKSYITSIRPAVQSIPTRSATQSGRSEARQLNAEAILLIRSNQPARAVSLLNRAYSISPFDAEIAGNYGYSLYLTGSLTEARDVLALALKLSPKRGSTWNNLGLTLAALNQTDWATECFVNYYVFSSRKDIAYRQMIEWETTGPLSLRLAVSNARKTLGLL